MSRTNLHAYTHVRDGGRCTGTRGRINVFTQGHGYMDSREYIEHDRGKRDRNAGDGDKGERETGRTSIGRRPRSAIRYIALQGVYRFTGSYQLSLLGDISMISARKRDREGKDERENLSAHSLQYIFLSVLQRRREMRYAFVSTDCKAIFLLRANLLSKKSTLH